MSAPAELRCGNVATRCSRTNRASVAAPTDGIGARYLGTASPRAGSSKREEPLDVVSGAHRATRPEPSTAFNPLTSLGLGEGESVRNLRPFTRFPEAFGPTLVQGAPRGRLRALKVSPAPVLNVREAAAKLRVSPATIYRLCAEGKLRHVRVSNALRMTEEDLEGYLRTSTSEKRKPSCRRNPQ
jgi:excisionase family DNA binding protein